MDFTEIYKQSGGLVAFSPGGHFILTAVQDRIVVRRADSFQITRTWQIGESADASGKPEGKASTSAAAPIATITHAGWSCDSEYILAACTKRGVVEVFKLRDEDFNARIDCGAEGLVKAEWTPDGRSILCFSEWGLRVTVWSLLTGTATHIQFPIHPDRGYAFSKNGRYFVLGERHKSKDTLGIYDTTQNYRLVRHFPLPSASLASVSLSPSGNHIAIWEGPLEFKIYILTLAGDLLGTFTPEPDRGLGVRCVTWHPSGAYLLVAGWDDKIYVLESLTWGPVAILELSSRIPTGVNIWREPSDWIEATQGHGFLSYEQIRPPWSLTITRPELAKAYPKCGPLQLSFNVSGTLLLARFESTPSVIHIYDFPSPLDPSSKEHTPIPSLRSVLIHTQPVLNAQWNPVRKGALASCCGSEGVYLWSDEWVGISDDGGEEEEQEMAECVGVPAKSFTTRDVKWAPDGKGLVIFSKDTFCCAFEVEDETAPVA